MSTTRTIRIETGVNEGGIRFRIRDDASGELLAGFSLNPSEIWDMLRGGIQTTDVEVSDRLDRVGKTMENFSVTFDREPGRVDSEAQSMIAVDKAKAAYPDWETYEPRLRNTGGVQVVMRRWV